MNLWEFVIAASAIVIIVIVGGENLGWLKYPWAPRAEKEVLDLTPNYASDRETNLVMWEVDPIEQALWNRELPECPEGFGPLKVWMPPDYDYEFVTFACAAINPLGGK